MTLLKFVLAPLLVLAVCVSASAATLTLRLARTDTLFNGTFPGATVPKATVQWESGDVFAGGQKIGTYLMTKDVNALPSAVAGLTTTLFIPSTTDVPHIITLQGVHSFNSGGQRGSVSASDFPGLVGVVFTAAINPDDSYQLTLNFP